ncbi:MAG: aldehyde dehydrogenase family protein, partial [Planctomycetales bacterium]
RAQSATTGLPEHMCRANMEKNFFVLTHMDQMLDALTRGLDLDILTRGYGVEQRGVVVSYQAQAPALGLVLPSNSPGVHTLWLPVIPMQLGLVLKPGPLEPWTPYRMMSAFVEAGVPAEAFSIYPGGADIGAAVVAGCDRCMIFGGEATIERYKGNPNVQVHGPGYSKILLGDDVVDQWEDYLDLMVDSVLLNSGRGCINCSGIWASRHTKEIAAAIAERIGPVEVRPPEDPEAQLAAFTAADMAVAIWDMIDSDLKEDGVEHMTGSYGERLEQHQRCAYLRPTVIHCEDPSKAIALKEFMYPFVTVVECPQARMIESIGPTLVASGITGDASLQQALSDATHIDRLNLGPIPTIKLDWLQPHEGNIVEFLYRSRAFQVPEEMLP